MAVFNPKISEILKGKVGPEPGELHLLRFLEKTLDDSYEIFYNPYMNGDRPDIVVLKKGQGILIIEVKDYELSHYAIDQESKNWRVVTKNTSTVIKSPISQVLKYKDNLFVLHIENLFAQKIMDIRNFNLVSCALYFHNTTTEALKKFVVEPFHNDEKYNNFLMYNILLLGSDALTTDLFLQLLKSRHLAPGQVASYFPDSLYEKINS